MGAVGPTQFVVMVNGRIKTFGKATGAADGVLNTTTDSFWSGARNGLPTSDPRVRYDRLSGRWFFTMVTVPAGSPLTNRLMVAYSDGGTLTGGTVFTLTFIDIVSVHNFNGGCAVDYDTLGIDANALYIGGNIFCGPNLASLQFLQPDGFVLSKAALLGGSPTASTFKLGCFSNTCPSGFGTTCPSPGAGDDGLASPQGVDNPAAAATYGYFAGISDCFFGELALARISNPGSNSPSVAFAFLAVPPNMFPEAAPALNSTHPLDVRDHRLMNAQLRGGHLWAAQTTCVDSSGNAPAPASTCPAGNRDGIRWYDIDVSTSSLNQSGTVFDNAVSNPLFYYYPSINVSGQGHVAIGFTESSGLVHAQAATVGRLASDPSGTMGTVNAYQTSTSDYNLEANPTSGRQRWGDYSHTSVDPSDDQTMWTIVEYANATNSWGVEVAQLRAPLPATPSWSAGGPFYASTPTETVGVTGTSVSGSGFFDAGPGFANRLSATVSGGVTVNSVSYTDPTHISININTTSAAPGMKDLTVTNPDGQAVTVGNFINIQQPPLVAVVGTDNAVWVSAADGPLATLGGYLIGAPGVVSVPNGTGVGTPLYIGTGGDHDLWVRNPTLGWQRLSGSAVYCIDNPAAYLVGGTLYVACQGGDHALWRAQVGGVTTGALPLIGPGSFSTLGGVTHTGPAVATVGGQITYFVLGTDQHVWMRTASTAWQQTPWGCIGHPAAATSLDGSATYFACQGLDSALWYATYSSGAWGGATSLGGKLIDGPGIAATPTGPTYYVEGGDTAVWKRTAGSSWSTDWGLVRYGVGAVVLG